MHRFFAPMAGSALALAALVACAPVETGPDRQSVLAPGSSYTITRIGTMDAPANTTLEVGADGMQLSGQGPCNPWTGEMTRIEGTLSITSQRTAAMACIEDARNAGDMALHQALANVSRAYLTSPDGDVAMAASSGVAQVLLTRN